MMDRESIENTLSGRFLFPGMDKDTANAAAFRMGAGMLANNLGENGVQAFGNAVGGGMDAGMLYARQAAAQQAMVEQGKAIAANQARLQAEAQAKQAEDARVQKYYGLAADDLEHGNDRGAVANMMRVNPGMAMNSMSSLIAAPRQMEVEKMRHGNAMAEQAQKAGDEKDLAEAKYRWKLEDEALKPRVFKAAKAASAARQSEPVPQPDEYQAPDGMRAVKLDKPMTPAAVIQAQGFMNEAIAAQGILREQEILHARIVKKYGTGIGAQAKYEIVRRAGMDNDVNQYNANLRKLAQSGLALQKGNQTREDYIHELETYAQPHFPADSHHAIIMRMQRKNRQTIDSYSALADGYQLVPLKTEDDTITPSGGTTGAMAPLSSFMRK